MDGITLAAAARVLGVTDPALRKMIRAGRLTDVSRQGSPVSVLASDVDNVLHERRTEAARRHPDALEFARQVRNTVWPDERLDMVVLADGRREVADVYQAQHISKQPRGREALRTLTPDGVAVFGRAAVEVAAMPRDTWGPTTCRWCYADASARALGGLRPVDSPAFAALLGADPCPQDRARWADEGREHRATLKRLRDAQTARERQAAQTRARQDFQAATDALSAASQRHSTALRRLAQTDLPTAVRAAGEAVRPARGAMGCGCTYARYCPAHAAQFGTTDRSVSRR